MPALVEAPYKINTDAGTKYTDAAKVWLQALGVQAFVVNGPASTDEY
jgi:hypothetical protein